MLNKSKDFAEVHGNAPYQFMQDNKFFNGQGIEVDEKGVVIEVSEKPVKLVDGGIPVIDDPRAELEAKIEEMTVEAIKLKLIAFEVEFNKKAVKADLVAMLVDEELAE